MAILNTVSLGGALVALIGLLLFIWALIARQLDPGHPLARFNLGLSPSLSAIVLVLGMVSWSVNGIVFYAAPGMSYLVQYPWGTQTAVLRPGFHMRWGGELIQFKKFLTVGFGGAGARFSGQAKAQQIRFNDSVTADMRMTARFSLPETAELFLPLAIAYRSQANLIHSSLIPIVQEAMRNAGRMYSAQEYIGGKGGDFENAVLDQVRNGIFLLDIREERISQGAQAITESEARTIQQDQTVRVSVRIRTGADGQQLRKDAQDHPLKKFGITLVQANVQDVDPDPAFKDKLKEQREAAAQVAIERQNARKEEERKKRIIAQGEAEKAEKKIELEKQQIQKVLAAETKAKEAQQEQRRRVTAAETFKKEAEIERERKAIELETARLESQRIVELAQAEARGRELKMAADGALEQRLAAYTSVATAFAGALKDKRIVPSVVISGGGDGPNGSGDMASAMNLINLIMSSVAMDLGTRVTERDTEALPTKPASN
ncbi:MAG: SPFH domain-containing protein [Pseudomonadota bacterium]